MQTDFMVAGLVPPAMHVVQAAGGCAVTAMAVVGVDLWVADQSGTIRVWELAVCGDSGDYGCHTCRTLCLHNGSTGHSTAVIGLASVGGCQGVMWSGSRDCTRLWHAYRRSCIMEVKRCIDMRCCTASADDNGEYIWTGHGDGSITKWRAADAELLLHIPSP
eukprot:SAG11_NODE_11103_length_783_cov_1.451754_2_plen_161_part_01